MKDFLNRRQKVSLRPSDSSVEENALSVSKNRLLLVMAAILFSYLAIVVRIFDISLSSHEDIKIISQRDTTDFFLQRADIVDRNGIVLATNLTTASVYANPRKVLDPKATAEKICAAFTDLSCSEVHEKLTDKSKNFIWIARHLTPRQQQLFHNLALPGLNFIREEKRVYPHGSLFSHVLGYVDIDSNGMAGIERYFNEQLTRDNRLPLELALDTRIQQILREELLKQIRSNLAIGGSGLILNAKTGEVVALTSLPDFDPHNPAASAPETKFNQVTLGAYEMGSTFKVLTLAMGLEGNFINVNEAFNTEVPITIGNHRIADYKGKGGYLSVPEILMYSSNIGTAQIAMRVGVNNQRNFLKKFGMLSAPEIEISEKTSSLYPSAKNWNQSSLITISYGHGIAVTPLQCARAMATMVNGGNFVKSTLLKNEKPSSERLISPQTSETLRKLLRLVAVHGYAKRADAEGYYVGGKTGTAEKVINGRYSKSSNLASFLGAFPMHDPQYVIVVLIDEPKKTAANLGITTGGMIAAPVAGKIIQRIAPILNITPENDDNEEIAETLHINFQPRYKPLN
jgi:cell division protein FtsI (penicillin-binding protein 3)